MNQPSTNQRPPQGGKPPSRRTGPYQEKVEVDGVDVTPYMLELEGKPYLQVAGRILLFRAKHPRGSLRTELLQLDLTKGLALFRATVLDAEGAPLADGHGSETMAGFSRGFIEKAESVALGRALAAAGFGTQFALTELDTGDKLADAPAGRVGGDVVPMNRSREAAPAKSEAPKPSAPAAPPPPPPPPAAAAEPPAPASFTPAAPATPAPAMAAEAPALPELAKGSQGPLSEHGLTQADKEILEHVAQEHGLAVKALEMWLFLRYNAKKGFVDLTQRHYEDALRSLKKYGAPLEEGQLRNLHAVGKDYGFTHDEISQLAKDKLDLPSLADCRLFHYEALVQELLPRAAKKAAAAKAGEK